MAKIAEDDRLEQLSAQKKRLKMLQLRKDVEQMMTERRQKRAEEMQRLMRLLEEEEKEQMERYGSSLMVVGLECVTFLFQETSY